MIDVFLLSVDSVLLLFFSLKDFVCKVRNAVSVLKQGEVRIFKSRDTMVFLNLFFA